MSRAVSFSGAPHIVEFHSCVKCCVTVTGPSALGQCNVSCRGGLCVQCRERYCGLCTYCFGELSSSFADVEARLYQQFPSPTPSKDLNVRGSEDESSDSFSEDGEFSDDIDATAMVNAYFNMFQNRIPSYRMPPVEKRRKRVVLSLTPDQFGNVDAKLRVRRFHGQVATRHDPAKRSHMGIFNPVVVAATLRPSRRAGGRVHLKLRIERVMQLFDF